MDKFSILSFYNSRCSEGVKNRWVWEEWRSSILNYGNLEESTAPKEGIGIWIALNREDSFRVGERSLEKWYNRIWWSGNTQTVLRLDYFCSCCWVNVKGKKIHKQRVTADRRKEMRSGRSMWWTVYRDRKASWGQGVGRIVPEPFTTIRVSRFHVKDHERPHEALWEGTSLNLCVSLRGRWQHFTGQRVRRKGIVRFSPILHWGEGFNSFSSWGAHCLVRKADERMKIIQRDQFHKEVRRKAGAERRLWQNYLRECFRGLENWARTRRSVTAGHRGYSLSRRRNKITGTRNLDPVDLGAEKFSEAQPNKNSLRSA